MCKYFAGGGDGGIILSVEHRQLPIRSKNSWRNRVNCRLPPKTINGSSASFVVGGGGGVELGNCVVNERKIGGGCADVNYWRCVCSGGEKLMENMGTPALIRNKTTRGNKRNKKMFQQKLVFVIRTILLSFLVQTTSLMAHTADAGECCIVIVYSSGLEYFALSGALFPTSGALPGRRCASDNGIIAIIGTTSNSFVV